MRAQASLPLNMISQKSACALHFGTNYGQEGQFTDPQNNFAWQSGQHFPMKNESLGPGVDLFGPAYSGWPSNTPIPVAAPLYTDLKTPNLAFIVSQPTPQMQSLQPTAKNQLLSSFDASRLTDERKQELYRAFRKSKIQRGKTALKTHLENKGFRGELSGISNNELSNLLTEITPIRGKGKTSSEPYASSINVPAFKQERSISPFSASSQNQSTQRMMSTPLHGPQQGSFQFPMSGPMGNNAFIVDPFGMLDTKQQPDFPAQSSLELPSHILKSQPEFHEYKPNVGSLDFQDDDFNWLMLHQQAQNPQAAFTQQVQPSQTKTKTKRTKGVKNPALPSDSSSNVPKTLGRLYNSKRKIFKQLASHFYDNVTSDTGNTKEQMEARTIQLARQNRAETPKPGDFPITALNHFIDELNDIQTKEDRNQSLQNRLMIKSYYPELKLPPVPDSRDTSPATETGSRSDSEDGRLVRRKKVKTPPVPPSSSATFPKYGLVQVAKASSQVLKENQGTENGSKFFENLSITARIKNQDISKLPTSFLNDITLMSGLSEDRGKHLYKQLLSQLQNSGNRSDSKTSEPQKRKRANVNANLPTNKGAKRRRFSVPKSPRI